MDSLLGLDPTLLVGKYWSSIYANFSDVYLLSVAVCVVVVVLTVGLTSKRFDVGASPVVEKPGNVWSTVNIWIEKLLWEVSGGAVAD